MTNNSQIKSMEIELLALDLSNCGRCAGTSTNVDAAVELIAGALEQLGMQVHVTRHVVKTAEQARRLDFVASPTIRINGRDIAVDFKQSSCKDCSDGCGCDGGIHCRVWTWRGKDYLEAPTAMIVDSMLRAYSDTESAPPAGPYVMPENLKKFFAPATMDCCDRTVCCEPSAKSGCCGEDKK